MNIIFDVYEDNGFGNIRKEGIYVVENISFQEAKEKMHYYDELYNNNNSPREDLGFFYLKSPRIESTFTQVYVCNECETLFKDEPEEECPVCKAKALITTLIECMQTEADYRSIKSQINNLNDSTVKFDLFNLINRKRKDMSWYISK